ncbi:hypothetical protein QMG83_12210 [Salinibacterium sp. G-O1]|uniref:hypothetical protein n=1 Tax=Salinibacterium sp. G-O1 TaxID=3046208 RepID=UPI0024BAB603|nr:hypothetical protein [Salinibacterium sp. G-O1]MDJ0335990.1 hypothetical protein [Salinibacterium sp. G-O1]
MILAETDLWGAAIPAWVGAVGSTAAAFVAVAAWIQSLRNNGGVQTLAKAAQQRSSPSLRSSVLASPDTVRWSTAKESRSRYRLRNDSRGATAELISFTDVTPIGPGAAVYVGQLPITVRPQESLPFTINKKLVSPSVTAIELRWREGGEERQTTLYV